MAKAKTTAPVSASAVTTTVSGFQIGILAFIPIDASDLRKQAEIPMLLLDIQEGRKTIADLAPHLKQVEFRQNHVRKRVPVEEAKVLFAKEGENSHGIGPDTDGGDNPDYDEGETSTVRDGETGDLVEDDD